MEIDFKLTHCLRFQMDIECNTDRRPPPYGKPVLVKHY